MAINYFLANTFSPLYATLKILENEKEEIDKPKEDSIEDFINKIQNSLKNADRE
jgi:hypothetical protein